MRKKEITDEELINAAKIVSTSMVDSFPKELPEHEFSDEFIMKIDKIRRKADGNAVLDAYISLLNKAARRSAAVFAALILCVSAWLTIDDISRTAVVEWIGRINTESVVYRHFGNSENFVNEMMQFTV